MHTMIRVKDTKSFNESLHSEYRQILSYHIYCIFLDSDGQVRLLKFN